MSRRTRLGIDTWKLFLRTQRVVLEKLRLEMRQAHDLPLTWFDVLGQLSLAGGRLRMTELAESVLLSTSGLTRLLDRMEKEGLIVREVCADDRRGYWAVLSEEGRRLARKTWPVHSRGIQQHFLEHLTEEEVEALRSTLTKILDGEDSGPARDRLVKK